MTSIPGLPIVSDAQLPAAVRSGSDSDKDKYKTAMGFEQMLVGQLVQTMVGSDGAAADATGTGDDDDTALDTSDPMTSGPFSGQMQDALSSALMSAGGLGLAGQIYKGMRSS
jgi:Rod binding domain-containing protein